MFKATQKNLPTDVAIFSAAVCDYKVKEISKIKIKKQDEISLSIWKKMLIFLNYVSNHNSMRPKLSYRFCSRNE